MDYTTATQRQKKLKRAAKESARIRTLTPYEVSQIIYSKICKSQNHTIPITPLIKKYGAHHNIKSIINQHPQTYKWTTPDTITLAYTPITNTQEKTNNDK